MGAYMRKQMMCHLKKNRNNLQTQVRNNYGWRQDTWDAMTDGMYGDMPDGFDGDFDYLGF